jgi:hypothetical protein
MKQITKTIIITFIVTITFMIVVGFIQKSAENKINVVFLEYDSTGNRCRCYWYSYREYN